MKYDTEYKILLAGYLVAALFVFGVAFFGVYSVIIDAQCAERGWRDSKITVTLTPYCINRTDQTDIIKKLSEI